MLHDFLAFASDADLFAAAGFVCWIVAVAAFLAERRRHARRDLDRVGWVPWTGVFLAAAVCGTTFLLLGSKALVAG